MVVRSFLFFITVSFLTERILAQCPLLFDADQFYCENSINNITLSSAVLSIDWATTDGDFELNPNYPAQIILNSPGTYCAASVDLNGCVDTTCFTLIQPEVTIDVLPTGCCSGAETYTLSATIQTNFTYSNPILQWQMLNGNNNWGYVNNDATFTGALTNTLQINGCGNYNGIYFRLQVSGIGCSHYYSAPFLASCSSDADGDGYQNNNDPDDLNPCVPDYCSPSCDYDLDGLPNNLDDDDDDDGCNDASDESDCDATSNSLVISSSSLCPVNGATCDQVCEYATITYSVENPEGWPVVWKVTGAESFTPLGNEVLVNWGSEGLGQVEAFMPAPCDNFYVTCGQIQAPSLDSISPTGIFFRSILKGCPSQTIYHQQFGLGVWQPLYNIFVTGTDFESYTTIALTNENILGYTISTQTTNYKISDDNIQVCNFNLTQPGEPNVSIKIKSLKQPFNCSVCAGKIEYQVYSELPLASTVLTNKSTGEVLSNLDNLCPGIYTITATDITGHSKIQEVVVACGEDGSCSQAGVLCVEIKASPQAIIQTVPMAVNNSLELCKGETVLFTYDSENAPQVAWNFGDGTSAVQTEVAHSFGSPGTYQVSLLARNGCACFDTTTLNIVVNNEEIPDIQCIGSVCLGDSATYRSNQSCGDYQWSTSPNGTIIGGGSPTDDHVTVLWETGGTGYVELSVNGCTGNICPKPIQKLVSIMGGNVDITGPVIVCPNSQAEYLIPDFQGANIIWTVDAIGSSILEGQGTNKATVLWGESGGTVSVQYDNCFMECGGNGQLAVAVKSPTYLEGPIEVCVGDAHVFKHKSLVDGSLHDASWQLLNSNGTIVWSFNAQVGSISPSWNFPPGNYTLHAVPLADGGSCSADAGLSVRLFGPLPAPAIDGSLLICPTNLYAYTAFGSLPNANFEWQITNGNNTTTKTGPSITVKWGNNQPYQLTLWQWDSDGPGCPSTPVELEIQPQPAVDIVGASTLCKGTTATYEADFLPDVDYEWEVVPATSGAVLSGQGSSTVQVFWQKAGTASLKLTACGVPSNFMVEIVEPIVPQIIEPTPICTGETTQVQVLGNYMSFQWQNTDGMTVSTSAAPNLGPGHYLLETTDATGCEATAAVFVQELPSPDAQLLAANTNLCLGPASFLALQTADGLNYQWFRNGSPIGDNAPTWVDDQPGNYWVVASSANGCTASSNQILVLPCDTTSTTGGGGGNDPSQGGGGGTPCEPVSELSFDVQYAGDCSQLHLVNTSLVFVPGSLQWTFWDGNDNLVGTATGDITDFVVPGIGFYEAVLSGQVPSQANPGSFCDLVKSQVINNTLFAKFNYQAACIGLPTKFTDLSAYMGDLAITDWHWEFGDPSSGTLNQSTQQHPEHVYSQIGAYQVTLTVTSSTGCLKTFSKTVTVHDLPTVTFAPPAANCAAIALNFVANGGNGAVTFTWDFGDPNSGNANTSQSQSTWHTYPVVGSYPVTVTAANLYGCASSYSSNVAIQANDLVGNISPSAPPPSCEAQPTVLTAPPGGSSWYWSNGATVPIINASLSGIYSVTITDGLGCIYKPDPVVVEVIQGPVATIRAVKLNEFGQPISYHTQSYTACEGEEVYLEMNGQPKYTYQWSDGSTGEQLIFTEASGGVLPTGLHSFTVTVTDIITGCTSVEGPFPVTIHGAPASVAISSTPPGPLCDGTMASFSVTNPQVDYAYVWNTGASGLSMTAAAAGSYLVQATNQYGCVAKSNAIEIYHAPNMGSVPTGCYTRCNPTEICLPEMPEVATYQWFLNGAAIPLPAGGVANLEASENGDYQVQMTSVHGCVSLSGLLSLELLAPMGNVSGTVWLDENGNGVIDPADSPLAGIPVLLSQNGAGLDTLTTGALGSFDFGQIPAEAYFAQIDTANLPLNLEAIIGSLTANLETCNDSTIVQFLVKDWCAQAISDTLQLGACMGDSVFYNGQHLPFGTSAQYGYTSFYGCDSTVIVNAMAFPVEFQSIGLMSCPGVPIIYHGQTLMPGDSITLVYQNQFGCDSTIAVSVGAFQTAQPTLVEVSVCPGDSLQYQGQMLWPGDVQSFTLQDQNGCDSLVNLTISAYPQIAFDWSTEPICPVADDGVITIAMHTGDGPFSAFLNGVEQANAALMEGLTAGTYDLQISDVHGCSVLQNIEIQALAPLAIAVEDYVLPCNEPFVTLRPTVLSYAGNLKWEWPDASNKEWFQAKQGGVYAVQVSDDCSSELLSIHVAWGDNAPTEPFYVPNAFSPNDDGINDLFRVYPAYGTSFLDFECTVFNRWGDLLFNSQDAEAGWDGSFKGKPADTGVYTWYVHAKLMVCGREVDVFKEGSMTVVR